MLSLLGKDIISIRDLEKREIELILDEAEVMENKLRSGESLDIMKGKVLANLFFEPSTRTKLSFEVAMQKLGGNVIGFEDIASTSMAKGESLIDTVKVVEKYCDIIVIRHPKEGAARLAAEISDKPVINAGDGANQHPTQTLVDLFTIRKLKGKIENLNVSLVGDLKYGRVMKSLFYALGMFGANITLASPIGLQMLPEIIEEVRDKFQSRIFQTTSVSSAVSDADVIYVCRIQKERFTDPYEAERMQKDFKITPELLKNAKEDAILLHPLPKVEEIDARIDETKFAKYYEQAFYGIPVRMAILSLVC